MIYNDDLRKIIPAYVEPDAVGKVRQAWSPDKYGMCDCSLLVGLTAQYGSQTVAAVVSEKYRPPLCHVFPAVKKG